MGQSVGECRASRPAKTRRWRSHAQRETTYLEVRAGLNDITSVDNLIAQDMVMPSQDNVDITSAHSESVIVGLPHMGKSNDEVAFQLVPEESREPIRRLNVLLVLEVLAINLIQSAEPVQAGKCHKAKPQARALEYMVFMDSTKRQAGGLLLDVGAEPWEVGLSDAGLHDIDAAIEVVVSDTGDVDGGGVEDRRDFGAFGDASERGGGECVARKNYERGAGIGNGGLANGGYETRGTAHGLARGYIDVVHVVAGGGLVYESGGTERDWKRAGDGALILTSG